MIGARPGHLHRAAGHRRRDHEGTRLDAVRDDGVLAAAQLGTALDGHLRGARAPHAGPHARQHARQADVLRLARRVLEHGRPLGERGGHHELLGRPHGGEVEHDLRAAQALRLGLHVALADAEPRAELLEAAQVEVDGPRADGAAAGGGDARVAKAGEERPQHEEGGAHRLHQLVGRLAARDRARLDHHLVPVGALRDARAQVLEHLDRGAHVGERRHVPHHRALAREQGREEERQRRVLGPAHHHLALELGAPPDHDRVHPSPPKRSASTRSMPA